MISSGPSCYDALNAALTKLPLLWRHDLNVRWSERRREWVVEIQKPASSGPTSGGTS